MLHDEMPSHECEHGSSASPPTLPPPAPTCTELKKAMMTVTSAWKDANFVLPENQLDTSAAEDTNMEEAV